MGFFDKIRSGRLFFGKKEPSMIVQFHFKGQKYIVEKLDIEFKQEVNAKGKPDSFPVGGLITVTISDIPSDSINSWMVNSFQKQDGEFRFLTNNRMICEGAKLHVRFKDAYCVSYKKVISPVGAGVLTTLVISPHILRIDNEEFENRWSTK